jgi:hypothetical protein
VVGGVVKPITEICPRVAFTQLRSFESDILRYSNEKPFILPVEATLAFQDTSASSNRFVKEGQAYLPNFYQ